MHTNTLPFTLLAASVLASAIACGSEVESPELAGEPGAQATSATAAGPAALERGREIYKTYCVACHGESGKGDGPGAGVLKPPPRDHTDPNYMRTLSDEEIGRIIQVGGAMRGKPLMPSHPQLREDDLAALVAYVRSLSEGVPAR